MVTQTEEITQRRLFDNRKSNGTRLERSADVEGSSQSGLKWDCLQFKVLSTADAKQKNAYRDTTHPRTQLVTRFISGQEGRREEDQKMMRYPSVR